MRSLILRAARTTFVRVMLAHFVVFWSLFYGAIFVVDLTGQHAETETVRAVHGAVIRTLGWPAWPIASGHGLRGMAAIGVLAANSFVWATAATIGVRAWRRWRARTTTA